MSAMSGDSATSEPMTEEEIVAATVEVMLADGAPKQRTRADDLTFAPARGWISRRASAWVRGHKTEVWEAAATMTQPTHGLGAVLSRPRSASSSAYSIQRSCASAVTVAVLFLACLFFAPLAQSIPAFATAPALIFIATYFLRNLKDIDWDDVSEYAPAVLAAVIMPLTFSIAYGIALGFIAYVVIKAASGRRAELNGGSLGIAAVSLLYFVAV